MPYRVARIPGDARRLVLRPVRGLGSNLLVGLGVASSTVGVVLATQHGLAGALVAAASGVFSGWLGGEMLVTRVEILRDEREGRVVLRWVGIRAPKEVGVPMEDLRKVVLEASGGAVRVVLALASGERIALTPYQTGDAEELRRSVADFLSLGSAT